MWNKFENRSYLGSRTKGVIKTNTEHLPLVSVVTVVYNAEKYLEKTILSIIGQSYDNIELIIVDGNSNDRTKEIILKYENFIDYAISEIDFGIYDAMNKAIDFCNGELVNFMNAGDQFYSINVVDSIVNEISKNFDIYYGDISVEYNGYRRVQVAGDPDKLWKGMVFSHQSTFTRLKYLKKFKFEKKYKIVADMNFFIRAYIQGLAFKRSNLIVASVLSGGLSDSNRLQTVFSSFIVAKSHFSSPKIIIYYTLSLLDTLLRIVIKKILKPSIVNKIIQLKK